MQVKFTVLCLYCVCTRSKRNRGE